MNNTPINSVVFIKLSDLRRRSVPLRRAVEVFIEFEGHRFRFDGSARHTLITIPSFLDYLCEALNNLDFPDSTYSETEKFLTPFIGSVLIDLEN